MIGFSDMSLSLNKLTAQGETETANSSVSEISADTTAADDRASLFFTDSV